MALKGNLRDFPTPQLLNLIHLAHKTGSLVIAGSQEEAMACFQNGRLAYAHIGPEGNGLLGVLERAHKLSVAQSRVLKERLQQVSDLELGLLIVNEGVLTQQEILDCLEKDYVGVAYKLLDYEEGIFRFENDLQPPEGRILVKVGLENILQDGNQLRQESKQLQDEIPSLDLALKFTEHPGKSIRNCNLSAEEWRVVTYIAPENTIRKIAQTTRTSDLEIRRIVSTLRRAGLVEIVRPEAGPRFLAEKPVSLSPHLATSGSRRRPLLDRLKLRNHTT